MTHIQDRCAKLSVSHATWPVGASLAVLSFYSLCSRYPCTNTHTALDRYRSSSSSSHPNRIHPNRAGLARSIRSDRTLETEPLVTYVPHSLSLHDHRIDNLEPVAHTLNPKLLERLVERRAPCCSSTSINVSGSIASSLKACS